MFFTDPSTKNPRIQVQKISRERKEEHTMKMESANNKLLEIAHRIREMREISGFTVEEMAEKSEVSVEEYKVYESGSVDFSFSFLHKCAEAFGLEIF